MTRASNTVSTTTFGGLRPGSIFGRYEVVRVIGIGGMGSVFEAVHTLLRKRVALKILHTTYGGNLDASARFLREAETVARIRHANVVDISDVGIESGVAFLVMELLEGENLGQVLGRGQPLAIQAAVDLVLPIIAGLASVHRAGIVHRDIKPENVFLARDGQGRITPKIVDFGISKDLGVVPSGGTGTTQVHTVTGTPHYMSPEQARGSRAVDGRTDQYALGVMLYQVLTGELPYDSTSLLTLMKLIDAGACRAPRELRPEIPPALEAIVVRAMAREVPHRFPTTEALGQALLPFASERVRVAYESDFDGAAVSDAALLPLDPGSQPTLPSTDLEEAILPPSASPVQSHARLVALADPAARKRHALLAAGALVVALAALAVWLETRGPAPVAANTEAVVEAPQPARPLENEAPPSMHVVLRAEPAEASIELDGVVVGTGAVDLEVPVDGSEHVLRVLAAGYQERTLAFSRHAPPSGVVRLVPVVAPAVAPATSAPPSRSRAPRGRDGASATTMAAPEFDIRTDR